MPVLQYLFLWWIYPYSFVLLGQYREVRWSDTHFPTHPNYILRIIYKGNEQKTTTHLTKDNSKFIPYWNMEDTVSQWASYQIRKLQAVHAPRMPGTFSRHRLQGRPLVNDTGMHHGTCVTHQSWCMSGSQTRGGRENVPVITGVYATRNFTYLVKGP